jgi:periplasmic copper chaperone A
MKQTLAIAAVLLLAGCSSNASPGVLTSEPWVRTTDEAQRPEMTAVYVNLTNPSSEDVRLVEADCGDVAESAELHEMVTVDGKVVMQQAEGGIVVPGGSHQHLAPGGPHIMLVGLARELPVGSEEITCTLVFDDGSTRDIVAPVKAFTEEQDTYHEHG